MKKMVKLYVAAAAAKIFLCALLNAAWAQQWGENVNYWNKAQRERDLRRRILFSSDSLWLGAVFFRDATKPFKVWLDTNEAGCRGALYLVRPNGTERLLFYNKQNSGPTMVDLTNENIPHGDTVYFMYKVISDHNFCCGCDTLKLYTGPNRRQGDPQNWLGFDRHWSPRYRSSNLGSHNYPPYRRWCVAGWLPRASGGGRSDTVEFGFEDVINGDDDFDDIVYNVTGLTILIPPKPIRKIELTAIPSSATIAAGDSVIYKARVYIDSLGVEKYSPEKSRRVSWTLSGNPRNRPLKNGAGPDSTNTFYGTVAYETYIVTASIYDSVTKEMKSTQLSVMVVPGAPHHIVIESRYDTSGWQADPNRRPWLQSDRPIGDVVIAAAVADTNVYTIIRDRYGNWVRPANRPTWSIDDPTVATVGPGAMPQNGQGLIRRVSNIADTTMVYSDSGSLGRANARVIVETVTYTALRISRERANNPIKNFTITTDDSIRLLAEGRNSATGAWDPLTVNWNIISLSIDPNYPVPSSPQQSWMVYPGRSDTGKIWISRGSLRDTVDAIFLKGAPNSLVFYRLAGDPFSPTNSQVPPPYNRIQLIAGQSYPIFSKVFDRKGEWLSQYENNPSNASFFSWRVIDEIGTSFPTYLKPLTASSSKEFSPTRAHHVYTVSVIFNDGTGRILNDTATFAVAPGTPMHLVIESDPTINSYPNSINPYYSVHPIELSARDTAKIVYAVLRDEFYNYYGTSPVTIWSSQDDSVVTVQPIYQDLGGGLVRRVAKGADTTQIIALDNATKLADTAWVYLRNVTYDSLRILVRVGNERRDIDSLIMRTDQDTTLLAYGLRSDNGQWEPVSVRWTISNAAANPAPPVSAGSWTFSPADTVSRAQISISLNNKTDRVGIKFVPGLPAKVDIYNKEGSPLTASTRPYPDTALIVRAGDTIPLVAKMFDHRNVWLSEYENDAQKSGLIYWSISNASAGNLTSSRTHKSSFVPLRAFTTVEITATYMSGNTILTDIIRFRIEPGAPAQLFIEASAERSHSPNEPKPVGTVTLDSRDSVKTVHAILRDKFGNYVRPSDSTSWSSENVGVVKVFNGFVALGEGIIRRNAAQGVTNVAAADLRTGYSASVMVILRLYTIDSLRIVVEQPGTSRFVRIKELNIRVDQDTTLWVIGLRSVATESGQWWEPTAVRWSSPGLTTTPAAPSNDSVWSFIPTAVGRGWIVVSNDRVSDSIAVTFSPGLAATMSLYNRDGQPIKANEYPQTRINLAAGDSAVLVANVFDKLGSWLSQYAESTKDSLFSWEIIEGAGITTPSGKLEGKGYKTLFLPTKAYRNVSIIASFRPEHTLTTLKDTVLFSIVPGPAHHLVIEASPNAKLVSPNDDNPVDTIYITPKDTIKYAYAIIRDRFGNYVENSAQTQWLSLDLSLVNARSGSLAGEGVILRTGASGNTKVSATNNIHPDLVIRTDDVAVKVLEYFYKELRIVDGSGRKLDFLHINTNDDTTLYVQGLRSDNDKWENVSANWAVSEGLDVTPEPPVAHFWRFSPDAPSAKGFIRVFLDNDVTKPDTIEVQFDPGPPIRAEFVLLTPDSAIIAGQRLVAVVKIYNKDGLVPGTWTYCQDTAAIYQDKLGDGGRSHKPYIIVDGDSSLINERGRTDHTICQQFTDGIDTVNPVLFYAPYDRDSLHQLYVVLNGIEASTVPFRLKAAELAQIRIERSDGSAINDTILYTARNDFVIFYSRGYDKYGNKRGDERANWGVDDSLPAIEKPKNVPHIFYGPRNLLYTTSGYLYVCARSGCSISDSVRLTLMGVIATLEAAITRDTNGNGYLDRIELHFSKPVTFPSTYNLRDIVISYGGAEFTVVDIVGRSMSDTTDSVFYVVLEELETDSAQTSYRPTVIIRQAPINGDKEQGKLTIDGAGPVIWQVKKIIEDVDDRTRDRVIIIFSEPVQGSDGNAISAYTKPSDVLNVWMRIWRDDGSDTLIAANDILKNVESFYSTDDPRVFVFYMSAEKDLTSLYYFSIKTDGPIALTDQVATGNPPQDINRQTRVVVVGVLPERITAIPNPGKPSLDVGTAGMISLKHDPSARVDALRNPSRSGIILTFKIPTPDINDRDKKVKGELKIFDVAGNLVIDGKDDDMLEKIKDKRPGEVVDIDIRWNGTNKKKMKVADGAYRVVLRISSGKEKRLLLGTVGVRN